MNKKFATRSDIAGMAQAQKRKLEKRLKENAARSSVASIESLQDLVEKDKQREKDGFPKRIKFGNVSVGPGKVIMVPYVTEEKLYHGEFEPNGEHGEDAPGQGEGKVGDVIYEQDPFGEDGG